MYNYAPEARLFLVHIAHNDRQGSQPRWRFYSVHSGKATDAI